MRPYVDVWASNGDHTRKLVFAVHLCSPSLKPDSIYLGLSNCGQTVDLKTVPKPLLNLTPALVAQLDSTVVTIFLRYGYHNRQLDRKNPYWFPCY